MSKGRYTKKKTRKFPVWALLGILAVVLVIAGVLIFGGNGGDIPGETEAETNGQTQGVEQTGPDGEDTTPDPEATAGKQTEPEDPKDPTDSTEPEEQSQTGNQTQTGNKQPNNNQTQTGNKQPNNNQSQTGNKQPNNNQTQTGNKSEKEDQDQTQPPEKATEPTVTGQEQTQPTEGGDPDPTQPTDVIVQQADAEYEKWLSAAMIVCVSMEYPDFELEGVYAASATALTDKFSSEGAYIVFTSGGTRMAIHAKALAGERTERGTMDISTETIGFATFDQVDLASLNLGAMEQLELNELSELIAQSLLVSIYLH